LVQARGRAAFYRPSEGGAAYRQDPMKARQHAQIFVRKNFGAYGVCVIEPGHEYSPRYMHGCLAGSGSII